MKGTDVALLTKPLCLDEEADRNCLQGWDGSGPAVGRRTPLQSTGLTEDLQGPH